MPDPDEEPKTLSDAIPDIEAPTNAINFSHASSEDRESVINEAVVKSASAESEHSRENNDGLGSRTSK